MKSSEITSCPGRPFAHNQRSLSEVAVLRKLSECCLLPGEIGCRTTSRCSELAKEPKQAVVFTGAPMLVLDVCLQSHRGRGQPQRHLLVIKCSATNESTFVLVRRALLSSASSGTPISAFLKLCPSAFSISDLGTSSACSEINGFHSPDSLLIFLLRDCLRWTRIPWTGSRKSS